MKCFFFFFSLSFSPFDSCIYFGRIHTHTHTLLAYGLYGVVLHFIFLYAWHFTFHFIHAPNVWCVVLLHVIHGILQTLSIQTYDRVLGNVFFFSSLEIFEKSVNDIYILFFLSLVSSDNLCKCAFVYFTYGFVYFRFSCRIKLYNSDMTRVFLILFVHF